MENSTSQMPTAATFTVRQFLAWANVSHTTFYKELSAGRLKAYKVGRRTLVRQEDAQAWLNSLPQVA